MIAIKPSAPRSIFLSSFHVTTLADGGWVVSWVKRNGGDFTYDVYQRHFNKDGQVFGPDIRVTLTTTDGFQMPRMTALADGGWVVTWQANNQDGSGYGIYQQRYDRSGNPFYTNGGRASDHLVNTTTANNQSSPSVTTLADGGWLVTWSSENQDESGYGVYQQRYSKDGRKTFDADQHVNEITTADQCSSSVTALADGGWIVTWQSGSSADADIYQQRFNKYGQSTSLTETRVNHSDTGSQIASTITSLADGGWVITWYSDPTGTGTYQAMLQRYDADGNAMFAEDQIIDTGLQSPNSGSPRIDVAALSDGSWVVTWTKADAATGTNEVYQRHYEVNHAPMNIALDNAVIKEASATGTPVGTFTTTDDNAGDSFTYELVGGTDGPFAIQNNQLVVTNGVALDYEQRKSYQITVRVTDSVGATHIENFTISVQNVATENVVGTSGDDKIYGGSGKDTFKGMDGNDTLAGGSGNDLLYGGTGRDVFLFNTKPNSRTNTDSVRDYVTRDDSIWLDNAVFTKLGKSGTMTKPAALKKAYLAFGTEAKDGNDYLLYHKGSGKLFYDADATGRGAPVLIAIFKTHPSLSASEFFVV